MASPGSIWLDLRAAEEREASPLPPAAGEALYGVPEREVVELPLGEADLYQQSDALGIDKGAPICCFATDAGDAAKAQGVLEAQGFTNVTSGSFDDVKDSAAAGIDLEVPSFIYPRLAVQNTLPLLAGMVGIIFLVVITVVTLGHGALTEDSGYDWVIADTVASERWDGFNAARDQVDEVASSGRRLLVHESGFEASFVSDASPWLPQVHDDPPRRRAQNAATATRSKASDGNSLLLLYETKDGTTIFTPQHLQSICKVEAVLLGHPEYPQFCRLHYPDSANTSDTCAPQGGSFVESFYGSNRNGCPLLSAAAVDSVRQSLTNPAFFGSTGFFFGSDIMQHPGWTSRARSNLILGGPLSGYTSTNPRGRSEQQSMHYQPFWEKIKADVFTHFGVEDYNSEFVQDGLDVLLWGRRMGDREFDDTVNGDLGYSLGSILIVLCFLVLHTGSWFLGGFGMLQILMSMPCSLFLYRTIAGVDFVTQLHVLAVYLVLGIGAAGAMFTTSFTTAIAFIATASSPVMPISAFGYFAACTVIMNYVLVMTIFPCLLVIWDKYGSNNCCCCDLPIPGFGVNNGFTGGAKGGPVESDTTDAATPAENGRALERFFVNTYSPLITETPAKFVLVGLYFCYFVFSAYYATEMAPPEKPEQWFPDRHMLTKLGIANTKYIGGEEANYVWDNIVWGLEGVNRGDDFNRWVPADRGTAVFDTTFDLTTSVAQQHFVNTCNQLRTKSCVAEGCQDGRQMLIRPGEIKCWIEDWRTWYSANACGQCADDAAAPFASAGASCQSLIAAGNNCSMDLSLVHETSSPGLATLADHCKATCGVCNVTDVSACIANTPFPTGTSFVTSIKQFRSDPVHFNTYGKLIGVIDGQLKYAALSYALTLMHDQPQKKTRTVWNVLETMLEDFNAQAPPGMNKAYHAEGGVWTWMFTQTGLVDNVFTGFTICFPAAFLVLLFSTQNLVTSSVAIVTIAGVVGCVLGLCKFYMDWGLGVAESIAAVIVIGFSVDFTVHLAHMYSEAGHMEGLTTRNERTSSSARTMGVTVTMGACTTLGSGMMLWMCTLTFFTKFAVLIISTICFSLTAALFFFMPLMAVVGPEDDFGDVLVWYKTNFGGGAEGAKPATDSELTVTTENPNAAKEEDAAFV